MVTRAALDLPCPINPPYTRFAPGSAEGDDVPALRHPERHAGRTRRPTVVQQRVRRRGPFGRAGIGHPQIDVAGVLGGGGPHLQRRAHQVAGQHVALVGDHLRGDPHRQGEHGLVAAPVDPHRRGGELDLPAVLDRPVHRRDTQVRERGGDPARGDDHGRVHPGVGGCGPAGQRAGAAADLPHPGHTQHRERDQQRPPHRVDQPDQPRHRLHHGVRAGRAATSGRGARRPAPRPTRAGPGQPQTAARRRCGRARGAR